MLHRNWYRVVNDVISAIRADPRFTL